MRLGISKAPGRAHAPNVKETSISECLTERTQRNAAKNDPTGSSNAWRYRQQQPGTTANTRRLAAHDAVSVAALRIMPALFATRVRSTSDPVGRRHVERQAEAMRAVHGLLRQGRDTPASELGRHRRPA